MVHQPKNAISKELMHIKHLIKEAIEKGVPIDDYIKSLDSNHRYYPILKVDCLQATQLNRKNTYENKKRTN